MNTRSTFLAVVEGRSQCLNIDFLHLPHLCRHSLFLRLIFARVPLVEVCGRDLPTDAKPVDQPTALHRSSASRGQLLPISVDFSLRFTWNYKRKCIVGEWLIHKAIQEHDPLPQDRRTSPSEQRFCWTRCRRKLLPFRFLLVVRKRNLKPSGVITPNRFSLLGNSLSSVDLFGDTVGICVGLDAEFDRFCVATTKRQ